MTKKNYNPSDLEDIFDETEPLEEAEEELERGESLFDKAERAKEKVGELKDRFGKKTAEKGAEKAGEKATEKGTEDLAGLATAETGGWGKFAVKAAELASKAGEAIGISKKTQCCLGCAFALFPNFIILIAGLAIFAYFLSSSSLIEPPNSTPEKIPEIIIKEGHTFPIPSNFKYFYRDSWGDCRGGSTRKHKGTDIMAALGTPAVAVADGVIGYVKMNGEKDNGGNILTIKANDGNVYYYMHMDTISVQAGQKVKAGDNVGTVGNSGNAQIGAEHIHFEIHPDGGAAVNPYPYLKCWDPKFNECSGISI